MDDPHQGVHISILIYFLIRLIISNSSQKSQDRVNILQ